MKDRVCKDRDREDLVVQRVSVIFTKVTLIAAERVG